MFHPGQILFLECDNYRLYTELIQVVDERQLCWVRPLFLVNFQQEQPGVTDLRDGSDLLWSVNLFHRALDTDVITFLSQILAKEAKPELEPTAKQQLNLFIQMLWRSQQNDSGSNF
jgi:hypothetical protein